MTKALPEINSEYAINGVRFKNRLIRSSIGGRTAYYDGTVNDSWFTFEKRFAENEIGGIISATLTVDKDRWSPLEYPSLAEDKFITALAPKINEIQKRYNCRYIIQIGDPGYHTQTSLMAEDADRVSASWGFDPLYGYTNFRSAMSVADIKSTVEKFAKAAKRVQEIGCDGLELTASKGYLIHQFLNPAINRRKDAYGGSLENRSRLLAEVIGAIRDGIGHCTGFAFGVRLSANDYSRRPWLALGRFGRGLIPSAVFGGNRLDDMLEVGEWLKDLGVDYLHITNGFGFINPAESPGLFPTSAVRAFCNSTRHLSGKAALRAVALNVIPLRLLDPILNLGWPRPEPPKRPQNMVRNLADAQAFKRRVGLPVIVNGGFQEAHQIQQALAGCDLVSMARPLLANPDLPTLVMAGKSPRVACTFCNRCAVLTTIFPLGCYDLERFRVNESGKTLSNPEAQEAMQLEIEKFNKP